MDKHQSDYIPIKIVLIQLMKHHHHLNNFIVRIFNYINLNNCKYQLK